MRVRIAVAAVAALAALSLTAGTASAATPTIANGSNWLETLANSGETDNSGNKIRMTVVVKHDVGQKVTGLKIDDDWDGTDNTSSKTTKTDITTQQPTVVGGFDYSRVSYSYTFPTANTGMSCGAFGVGGTNKTTKQIRVRAVLGNGDETATSSSNIIFTRVDCNGGEDYPYLYQWAQSATSVNVGQPVTFTFRGDDSDSTGDDDFAGIRWRMRRLSDGTTTTPQTECYSSPYDNADKTLTPSFPARGRWVVEAELLDNSDCSVNDNSGSWYWIGAVDVNSPQASSPTLSLSATRPQINGNTTVTATTADAADSANGGNPQYIEWDTNGDSTYDSATLGSTAGTGAAGASSVLSTGDKQKVIGTNGQSPGLHTVRARVTDNGAINAADNSRRQTVATTTYLVDTPPLATAATAATESGQAVSVPFSGSDADGDGLAWSIASGPSHGTLSGSGASRTYTPDPGYAGTDTFNFRAADGYGGTSDATATVTVRPDTTIDAAPTGTIDSRGAQISFSSPVTSSATSLECSFDGAPYTACTSPVSFSDLPDGAHTFAVRASIASPALTDPTPAADDFTVDASPAAEVDSGPSGTIATGDASFGFSATEAGATSAISLECRLDDAPYRPCDPPRALTDVPDGDHVFSVRGTDVFGKVSDAATQAFNVDTTAPVTTIDDSPPALTRDDDGSVTFHADEEDSTFECSLDGAPFASCSSPAAVGPGLADGPHSFRVRATDTQLNVEATPADATWTIDRVAPDTMITSGPSGPTSVSTPTFEFTSSEAGSSFQCAIDSGAAGPCSSPFTAPALSVGPHVFSVFATDPAGNDDAAAATRSFTVDTTPPAVTIDSGPSGLTADPMPTFTFSSPGDATASFRCRLDSSDPDDFAPCPASFTTPALADGPHSLDVLAVDAAGNEGSSIGQGFTVDTRAPDTSIAFGPAALERSGAAGFQFTSSEAGSTFECRLDSTSPAAFTPCTSPQAYSGLADGAHTFEVRAIDPAANADPTPASRSWTVDSSALPPGSTQPPAQPEPAPETCHFGSTLADCGSPSLTTTLKGSAPVRGASRYDLGLSVDSGGAELSAATFSLPHQLAVRLATKPATPAAGVIRLGGTGVTTVRLRVPKHHGGRLLLGSSGPVRVTLSGKHGPKLQITGIPAGVTSISAKVLGRRSGLLTTTKRCATLKTKVSLRDQSGALAAATGLADVACPKRGSQ